jgi:anaerobic magnesium-protoporphyrin IX monomethyl ester cyclase
MATQQKELWLQSWNKVYPDMSENPNSDNIGSRLTLRVTKANFPNADPVVHQVWANGSKSSEAVDILLVNPPTPDGSLWIRSQHRVGRRTRENMVWPQVSLAQLAALLVPTYSVKIIDANAERMGWQEFEGLIDRYQPRYYLTQVTAPTLQNDLYGVFLSRSRHALTIAFGTHVTPLPAETLAAYPALDFCLVGEPDLTLRDLLDHLEGKIDQRPASIQKLFQAHDAGYHPSFDEAGKVDLHGIKGLAWRQGDDIHVNQPRPYIACLDDLPMPLHELLPYQKYVMPSIKGPFTFIVTGRGCPAGCKFCIKHVSYGYSTRVRSPELIMQELWKLKKLGINTVNMYADLFTVNREQVMELCERMIREKIEIKWMCNSRVDFVDEEMLKKMGEAGCWYIAWGIESANEGVLKGVRKGITPEKVKRALLWSKKAGIKNWGYFIIGLPGETETSIRQTIDFAKSLPLDIALFHVAAPYPGTPFFFDVIQNGWFRPGTRWEQVDMDKGTVLDYPELPAERLLYWQKRAFREWAFRPRPILTYLKMVLSDTSTIHSALSVGFQHLSWSSGKE